MLIGITSTTALFQSRDTPTSLWKLTWDLGFDINLSPVATFRRHEPPLLPDAYEKADLESPWRHTKFPDIGWHVSPRSLLMRDGSRLKISQIRTTLESPFELKTIIERHDLYFDGGQIALYSRTINGYVFTADKRGGLCMIPHHKDEQCRYHDVQHYFPQRDGRDRWRYPVSQLPFVCPFSGLFGYVTGSGEVHMWQE